jgi:hypothetical protein
MSDAHEYTHLTWRARNAEGTVTTYVHTIPDRERAADEIKELALSPTVYALRVIHYPQPDGVTSSGMVEVTPIGPPHTA